MPLERTQIEKLHGVSASSLTCKICSNYNDNRIAIQHIDAGSPTLAQFLASLSRLIERLSFELHNARQLNSFELSIEAIDLQINDDPESLNQLRLIILEELHDMTDYQNVKSAPRCR